MSADRSPVSFPSAPRALSACRPPPPNWDDDESPDGLTPLLPSSWRCSSSSFSHASADARAFTVTVCACRDHAWIHGTVPRHVRASSWERTRGTQGICEIVNHSRMHAVFFAAKHPRTLYISHWVHCMFMLNANLANPFGSDSKSIWKVLRKTTAVV